MAGRGVNDTVSGYEGTDMNVVNYHIKMDNEAKCDKETMCVVCPYRYCVDAEVDAFFLGMEESAKDNQEILEKRDKMLRETVAELCEAKRLLKAAVEDFSEIKSYLAEPYSHLCDKWRYEDEALKLIEG